MNKKIEGLAISLIALGVMWVWLGMDQTEAPDSHQSGVVPHPWLSPSSSPTLDPPLPEDIAAEGVAGIARAREMEVMGPIMPAHVSMAEARAHGDDRAPPIEPQSDGGEGTAATSWEMSDPARYQSYEQRQQQRVYAAYAHAADGALTKWRAMMVDARERGVSEQDLIAGDEKIKKLEAMQAALVGGGAPSASRPQ